MRNLKMLLACSSAMLFAAAATTMAGDQHGHGPTNGAHGNQVCCPACNYVCEFSATKTKEEKHCYEVDCKPICIPRVTFPWEKGHGQGKCGDCSPARCAQVKVVKVLEKHTYECSRCKCKWTPVLRDGCDDQKPGEKTQNSREVDLPTPAATPPPTIHATQRDARPIRMVHSGISRPGRYQPESGRVMTPNV